MDWLGVRLGHRLGENGEQAASRRDGANRQAMPSPPDWPRLSLRPQCAPGRSPRRRCGPRLGCVCGAAALHSESGSARADRIELAFAPPDAPEHNPDESPSRDFETAWGTSPVGRDIDGAVETPSTRATA